MQQKYSIPVTGSASTQIKMADLSTEFHFLVMKTVNYAIPNDWRYTNDVLNNNEIECL